MTPCSSTSGPWLRMDSLPAWSHFGPTSASSVLPTNAVRRICSASLPTGAIGTYFHAASGQTAVYEWPYGYGKVLGLGFD
eukprot:438523-Pyramimonas_sp.AAC.1